MSEIHSKRLEDVFLSLMILWHNKQGIDFRYSKGFALIYINITVL